MIVHPLLEDNAKKIKKTAKAVGLNLVNYKKMYKLMKTKTKNSSPNGIPDSGYIIHGYPIIIGNEDVVALRFENFQTWFQTSGIKKTTKLKDCIKIETMNSVYKLYEK